MRTVVSVYPVQLLTVFCLSRTGEQGYDSYRRMIRKDVSVPRQKQAFCSSRSVDVSACSAFVGLASHQAVELSQALPEMNRSQSSSIRSSESILRQVHEQFQVLYGSGCLSCPTDQLLPSGNQQVLRIPLKVLACRNVCSPPEGRPSSPTQVQESAFSTTPVRL